MFLFPRWGLCLSDHAVPPGGLSGPTTTLARCKPCTSAVPFPSAGPAPRTYHSSCFPFSLNLRINNLQDLRARKGPSCPHECWSEPRAVTSVVGLLQLEGVTRVGSETPISGAANCQGICSQRVWSFHVLINFTPRPREGSDPWPPSRPLACSSFNTPHPLSFREECLF